MVYGDSEARLGEAGVAGWHVVTKLPAVPGTCPDLDAWVRAAVAASLERLQTGRVAGLLLHRPQQLLEPRGAELFAALQSLKADRLVDQIGVSISDPAELDELCCRFAFDLVQAPFNVFDRRLATSGWLARLHRDGVAVHARSAFLQGLLLLDAGARPAQFAPWQPLFEQWQQWLEAEQVPSVQACLAVGLAEPAIDRVIVGVDSLRHLEEIVAAANATPVVPPMSLTTNDTGLINPARWAQ